MGALADAAARRSPDDARMGTIVVGVDGSAEGDRALRFALAEARLRGSEVRAVHAWAMPYYEYPIPLDDVSSGARALLDDAVDRVVAGEAEAVPTIARVTSQGQSAAVLIDESRHADLLVVGSRGHGELASLLLGSTSMQCAHHARCPVAIVRPARP